MNRMTTKQSELSHSNEDLAENPKLMELKYQCSDIESQLMGLGRYCDRMMLEKKILGCIYRQKEKSVDLPLLPGRQERKLLQLKQRVTEISRKISEYDQFYKNFNL
jgi:hypothetical protein